MSRTCPMWQPEPGRYDIHEECDNPSPREDYEHQFGYIDEQQWQWVKEWVARNAPERGDAKAERITGLTEKLYSAGLVDYDNDHELYRLLDGHGGAVWFRADGTVVDVQYCGMERP